MSQVKIMAVGLGPIGQSVVQYALERNDLAIVAAVDPAPALYPLEQSFWAPDGRHLARRGFMAAVRLHDFAEGIIVPHEKTLAAPKADRLEILKAVKANLSPIFGLYRDEKGATARALGRAFEREPVHEADSDDGVHHRLWRVEDPAAIARYLPRLERCANFIETRRDPTNNLFRAGPAANLLAPSFAGWKRSDRSRNFATR